MSTPLPPPQPQYILRGHLTPIHALSFFPGNTHLLTGDAFGFVILWSLSSRRAAAVWRAHSDPILALSTWSSPSFTPLRILTHGRDHKLHVWKSPLNQEPPLSTALPAEDESGTIERRNPWLVASIGVNALNFCGFALCVMNEGRALVAVPASLDSEGVDVMGLPDGKRRWAKIKPPAGGGVKTGMAMSLALREDGEGRLCLAAGYESGNCIVYRCGRDEDKWQMLYCEKPHSQPVLSLAWGAQGGWVFTSSADDVLVRHEWKEGTSKAKKTGHLGQQGIVVRSDEKLVATAGWDGRVRVYSAKGQMRELAVLKWHTVGCYAVAFSQLLEDEEEKGSEVETGGAEVVRRTVEEERERRETRRHWVVAGAKDGKVSMWEIY